MRSRAMARGFSKRGYIPQPHKNFYAQRMTYPYSADGQFKNSNVTGVFGLRADNNPFMRARLTPLAAPDSARCFNVLLSDATGGSAAAVN
jgi:hypothetical protein